MKRLCFLSFLLCTVLTLSAYISHATYKGKIGPYGVEFIFAHDPDMGNGAQYRYLTKKVNHGNWITLEEAGFKGKYQIFKEYINGRNTGTFYLIFNNYGLKGNFVNSQGKKYTVSAKRTSSYSDGF